MSEITIVVSDEDAETYRRADERTRRSMINAFRQAVLNERQRQRTGMTPGEALIAKLDAIGDAIRADGVTEREA